MVSVLRDGYRVPFLDSLPPLTCSPRSLALLQKIKMLAKGTLEIVLDPGSGFYSRLFFWRKGDGRLASHDRSLSPERVCSSNSVNDGDSHLGAALRPRGRFPSFRGFEGRVFSNTRSSVLAKAVAFHVGGDNLPIQGPVLRTVDCPPRSLPECMQPCQRGRTLVGFDFYSTGTTGWSLPPRRRVAR